MPDLSRASAYDYILPPELIAPMVELWRQGIAPEAILQHLPHLTLAQIFDALSYYSDNQSGINGYIARNRVPDDFIDPLVRPS